MAKKEILLLTDDIDGSELTAEDGETVSFSLGAKNYEIDLSSAHARELREALNPYIAAARRVGGKKTAGRTAARKETEEIRSWARVNGYSVSDRGRIPFAVVEAYNGR